MTAFVPLVPGALRAATEPSATTRPKPASSAAAQSLFQPATPANLQNDLHGSSPTAHKTHGEPKITLERQGDTITHIRVQCPCGQVIELRCQY